MGSFRTFEDIEAWQEARALTRSVYAATMRRAFARDAGLRNQIRRASVSIMSNIAEGFERGGNREFLQFLSIAKGSVGEVRAQLYVALDEGYIDPDNFRALSDRAAKTSRLIGGLMSYLLSSGIRGSKYHRP